MHETNARPMPLFPRQPCAFSLKAVQQAFWRSFYGALTPRHLPKRHGKYHRAPGGFVSGTLSIPDVPHGWQRNRRASVIHPPPHRPKRAIASSAYTEQVGRCRQL
jgi:hypothetical protein